MAARRILVRLPNWLGDLLMARPLLHALRAGNRGARIHARGTSASALLERESLWDAWTVWSARPGRQDRRPGDPPYDLAVVLPPSFSSAWFLPAGTGVRVGFAADGRSWLLTRTWRRPARGEMHLSDEYLRLGDLIDLAPPPDPLPLLLPNEADLARARARLEGLAVGEHRFAVLGPGAAYGPAKRWPLDRYVALGRGLRERGLAPLVCGASEDRHIAAPLASRIGPGAHALAGETSLGEQLALCAMASVTVCNDSGLAHLAAATGAPTVVIFGSTSSSWTAPRGPRVVVVQRSPVCSPCFRRTCRIGYRCLEAVTTRRVLDACEEAAA